MADSVHIYLLQPLNNTIHVFRIWASSFTTVRGRSFCVGATFVLPQYSLTDWLIAKLLLALASSVVLGSEPQGTQHHGLLPGCSGSLDTTDSTSALGHKRLHLCNLKMRSGRWLCCDVPCSCDASVRLKGNIWEVFACSHIHIRGIVSK
jgi:hypothetical protein